MACSRSGNVKKQTVAFKGYALFLQAIFLFFIFLFTILYFFIPEFLLLLELFVALFLYISAYNNQKIYKRKFLTIFYALVATLFLIQGMVEIFGR